MSFHLIRESWGFAFTMESFNYDSAKKYAHTLIKEKGIYWIESDDVINDAFIQLSESGKEYSWDLCREAIKNICFNQKHNNTDAIYRTKDATHEEIDNKQCKMCHEVKSKHAFYILTHKNGVKQFSSYCKTCSTKRTTTRNKSPERKDAMKEITKKSNKRYWDKMKNKPSMKKLKNDNGKKHYIKNREKRLEYQKQYRLKNKLKNEEQ